MKKKLTSTEGRRWAFMKRYDINDINDKSDLYMRRWRMIQTPWFGIYLHRIQRPDGDRYLHDHPWPFTSFILKGGYSEDWLSPELLRRSPTVQGRPRTWGQHRTHMAGSVTRVRRGEYHSIRHLYRVPTWTLVFVGRRGTDWGYLTENGWVDHETQHRAWGL